MLDERTRECLAIEIDTSLPGTRVIDVLERLVAERGAPEVVVIDNGPEFGDRPEPVRIQALVSQLAVEGLHVGVLRRLAGRDEVELDAPLVRPLAQDPARKLARLTIEAWRQEYNQVRPRSALGQATPEEYARQEVMLRELLEP